MGSAMAAPIALERLNTLDRDRFVATLVGVFEGPPWAVEAAWERRPFTSVSHLHATLRAIVESAPEERQVALLRAHPDLVGRAALAGTLSLASTREQSAAGLAALTPEEIATFQRLNAEYTERFGFPFVICARENKKDAILTGLRTRLTHTREREIAIALAEVAKIAGPRLRDLVAEEAADGAHAGASDQQHGAPETPEGGWTR